MSQSLQFGLRIGARSGVGQLHEQSLNLLFCLSVIVGLVSGKVGFFVLRLRLYAERILFHVEISVCASLYPYVVLVSKDIVATRSVHVLLLERTSRGREVCDGTLPHRSVSCRLESLQRQVFFRLFRLERIDVFSFEPFGNDGTRDIDISVVSSVEFHVGKCLVRENVSECEPFGHPFEVDFVSVVGSSVLVSVHCAVNPGKERVHSGVFVGISAPCVGS